MNLGPLNLFPRLFARTQADVDTLQIQSKKPQGELGDRLSRRWDRRKDQMEGSEPLEQGKPDQPTPDPRRLRRFLVMSTLLFLVWTWLLAGSMMSVRSEVVPLGQLMQTIKDPKVVQARIDDTQRIVYLDLAAKPVRELAPVSETSTGEDRAAAGVTPSESATANNPWAGQGEVMPLPNSSGEPNIEPLPVASEPAGFGNAADTAAATGANGSSTPTVTPSPSTATNSSAVRNPDSVTSSNPVDINPGDVTAGNGAAATGNESNAENPATTATETGADNNASNGAATNRDIENGDADNGTVSSEPGKSDSEKSGSEKEPEIVKTISAAYPEGYAPTIVAELAAAGVALNVRPVPQASFLGNLLGLLLPVFIIIGFLVWFSRRQGGGMLNIGKLSAKKTSPVEPPTTRFTDVAGLDETVGELREIVELLEHPDRYSNLGARPSRGFLLVGPPGTGKTLLAKAVAGEAGVPFFALSGSDFTEMFVGVGASRVRELFAKARASAPAIIFVDEIDSVARQRGTGMIGGNDERENTLNQLLAELDGFESRNVIFIGATNRVDILDPALLRPGRFDRKIVVPLPDRRGREAILAVHATGKPLAADVDLTELARRTPGLSGADLAYLMNESALEAARLGATEISAAHLQAALATSILGKERKGALVTERDRTIVAWHEAGHATAALLFPEAHDPVTVTIIPRGGAGGVTWMGGSDDEFLTRSQALARLVVSMSGRGAEKILLNGDFTQGAHGDLSSATGLASEMIARFGMGRLLVASEPIPGTSTADRVNAEAAELISDAAREADELLVKHQPLLETIARRLLEEETLDGPELRMLADEHLAAINSTKRVRRPAKPAAGTTATTADQTSARKPRKRASKPSKRGVGQADAGTDVEAPVEL